MITDILFGMSEYGLRQARIAIIRQARRDRVLRAEYVKSIKTWNAEMERRCMEFDQRSDLSNEVYEKDIALSTFNTADEDLPF